MVMKMINFDIFWEKMVKFGKAVRGQFRFRQKCLKDTFGERHPYFKGFLEFLLFKRQSGLGKNKSKIVKMTILSIFEL